MSGGGGHIIIRGAAQAVLSNPIIHGHMTGKMQQALDPILVKSPGEWTDADDHYVAHCMDWALKNTQ